MLHWLQSKARVRDPRIARALGLSFITNAMLLILLFISFEPRLIVLPLTTPKMVYVMRPVHKPLAKPASRGHVASTTPKKPIHTSRQRPQPKQTPPQHTKPASQAIKKQPLSPPKKSVPHKPYPKAPSKKAATQTKPLTPKPTPAQQKAPVKQTATPKKPAKPPVQKPAPTSKPVPQEKKLTHQPVQQQTENVPEKVVKQQFAEEKKTPAEQQVQPEAVPEKAASQTSGATDGIEITDAPVTRYHALHEAIAASWRPPKGLANGQCIAQISFDKHGRVHKVHVSKTSGMLAFDMAVRAALWRAQYPHWVMGQTITVTFGNE